MFTSFLHDSCFHLPTQRSLWFGSLRASWLPFDILPAGSLCICISAVKNECVSLKSEKRYLNRHFGKAKLSSAFWSLRSWQLILTNSEYQRRFVRTFLKIDCCSPHTACFKVLKSEHLVLKICLVTADPSECGNLKLNFAILTPDQCPSPLESLFLFFA